MAGMVNGICRQPRMMDSSGFHHQRRRQNLPHAQYLAVISGAADEQRAALAMNSVTKYLLRDFGTLLNYPAFTKPRPDIGYVTRYAPGLRKTAVSIRMLQHGLSGHTHWWDSPTWHMKPTGEFVRPTAAGISIPIKQNLMLPPAILMVRFQNTTGAADGHGIPVHPNGCTGLPPIGSWASARKRTGFWWTHPSPQTGPNTGSPVNSGMQRTKSQSIIPLIFIPGSNP